MALIYIEMVLNISTLVVFFVASQFYWGRRLGELGKWLIASPPWRRRLSGAAAIAYLFFFAYNAYQIAGQKYGAESTHLTLHAALFEAPFLCWIVCSMLGFAVAVVLGLADRLVRAFIWVYRKAATTLGERRGTGLRPASPVLNDPVAADPPSPHRRRFLEQAVFAASAAPFVAGAYGLLYGRLNLEITRRRITLRRLPRAFDGFCIAQLSDIHIGPFMPDQEIRKYVAMTNELRPDLVLLTGDFVTWDPTTQDAVVRELARLKAPFGILGCLGNHETWTNTEDSITQLFSAVGIRILRRERAPIQAQGEALNLIGVDFQSVRGSRSHGGRFVRRYLDGIERLLMLDTANILLSHNPNTFDRAAELGIDLSLAGHTHGGQITLEFVHPSLSPARLITSYVRGWFENGLGQLYVNRGIGTIGVPVRVGSPPEITVFELTRPA